MPAPSTMTGAPCWVDLLSSDTEAAERFYGELFGWHAEHGDEETYGGYITFTKDGRPVAGGMHNINPGQFTDRWNIYLASQDAGATVTAAAVHQGSVYLQPMEVVGTGTMAMVGDPGGAAIGVWQAGPFAGFAAVAEPGMPSWFELLSRDYDRVLEFYRAVFGWQTEVSSDTAELRYTTLGSGDAQAAGVMDGSGLPAEEPTGWRVYFGVDDADAVAAQAEALGGRVVRAPEDTPWGRLGMLADPTGATFLIIQGPGA